MFHSDDAKIEILNPPGGGQYTYVFPEGFGGIQYAFGFTTSGRVISKIIPPVEEKEKDHV